MELKHVCIVHTCFNKQSESNVMHVGTLPLGQHLDVGPKSTLSAAPPSHTSEMVAR